MTIKKRKQTLLVIGGTGFFGSRICQYFLGMPENPYEVLSPTHSELDITNLEKVMNYFRKTHPDILIHCAAISDVVTCETDREKSYAINVTGVENLAKACAENQTKMIFCSSDQIYFSDKDIRKRIKKDAGKNAVPHKESEIPQPFNIYGRQKLEAEGRALAICPDAVCLRLSWMYDTVKLMEQEHGNFYGNIKAMLERGEVCRFPIHDLRGITYIGTAIENLTKVFHLPGGVYNYGAENTLCTYQLVKALFEKTGISEGCVKPNKQAFLENPRNISMDISKIRSFGIDFPSTLEGLIKNWE